MNNFQTAESDSTHLGNGCIPPTNIIGAMGPPLPRFRIYLAELAQMQMLLRHDGRWCYTRTRVAMPALSSSDLAIIQTTNIYTKHKHLYII